tara:strand:+ start:1788 stop:3380 length:1593 start_codon:yes stop_codon:yes gene_type:complete
MKLVRLTSTENKAMFDNTLNDPISLKAGASVALSNVAIASKPRNLIIDGVNGIVTWTTESEDGTASYQNELLLEPGQYAASDKETFIVGFEAKLNDNQKTTLRDGDPFDDTSRSVMVNTQWTVVENLGAANVPGQKDKTGKGDGKMTIGYIRSCTSWDGTIAGRPIPVKKDFIIDNVDVWTDDGYNALGRTTGVGDENAYMVGHIPMGWGPGGFAMTLNTIQDGGSGDPTIEGVFFGLTRTNHTATGTKPTRAECKFGIHCSYVGENYKIYKSGAVTDGGQAIAAGDSVMIHRDLGVLTAQVTDDFQGGSWDVLTGSLNYSYTDNATSPLYPVIIFYGADGDTMVTQMSYSPDAFKFYKFNEGNDPTYASDQVCLWSTLTGTGATSGKMKLNITLSQDVAEYLGYLSNGVGTFKYPNAPLTINTVSAMNFGWHAGRAFAATGASESFYVQLLSVSCEGYDGLKSGRENILAVIPKSDLSNQLLYDVANPLFLEIGNAFPITLRNISARILTEDGGEVPTDGLSVMTLLFK